MVADVSGSTHVVRVEIWGGVTGPRQSYLKARGRLQTFDDRLDAMNEIDAFYRRMADAGCKANATIEDRDVCTCPDGPEVVDGQRHTYAGPLQGELLCGNCDRTWTGDD